MQPWRKVALKELKEMLRDKRVRSGAFVMPLFLVVVFVALFGYTISAVTDRKSQRIHVVKTDVPLAQTLKTAFDVREVASAEQGIQMVRDGKARLVLEFLPSAKGQQTIHAHYDPKEQTGEVAFRMVDAVFGKANEEALKVSLKARGIPETLARPIDLKSVPVKVGEGKGASELIVSLLPYLLVLFAFTGGLAIAADLVAGEKEKNTLETLLISPIDRTQIVLGKTAALAAVCFASSMSGLIGFVLCSLLKLKGSEVLFQDGLGISPAGVGAIVLMMLPLSVFFASILVAVSAYAKNMREAQTYLGLLNLVVVLPAVFSQVIGLTDLSRAMWINAIPILNTATNIRAILLGKPEVVPIAMTVGVGLAIALAAGWLAVKLFQREEVLTRV